MVEWCKKKFENMTTWRHIIDAREAKIGQKNKTFYNEKWWIIENGPRQQTMTVFDNNKSTDGDEKTTWKTFKKAFCN